MSNQSADKQTGSKMTSKKLFGMSSLLGVARGIIGFPIEQPLEAIKTQWQAKPGFQNELKIAK